MSVPQIRLKTKDFRAIANADIIIDGITVVAGENGSGKSTLSKLLYFVFKTACNYEHLVEEELRRDLRDVELFCEELLFEMMSFLDEKHQITHSISELGDVSNYKNPNILENSLKSIKRTKYYLDEDVLILWLSFINRLEKLYIYFNESKKQSETEKNRSNRFILILGNILDKKIDGKQLNHTVFDRLSDFVEILYNKAFGKIKERPVELFDNTIIRTFQTLFRPLELEVFEYDVPIFKKGMDSLLKPYTISNTIYTDTPMSIGINDSGFQYWDDLNALLRQKNKVSNPYSKIISNEIINGEAALNIDSLSGDDYTFKRSDGAVFNLLDCATGIKSFAMLQILLNNGSLNDKTLLIIDEPEVHLHPKWIVEYARIIVMLNIEMGIKFFIASHDPDFISAIRYISEKEGNLDKVNFYLAEKAGDTFTYNYTHLQHNIDPIFKSFNIAISKIEEYGA